MIGDNLIFAILIVTSVFLAANGDQQSELKLDDNNFTTHGIKSRTVGDSWILGNIWSVGAGAAAIVFIFGGIAIAFYYFYYINYYGYSKDGYATSVSTLTRSNDDGGFSTFLKRSLDSANKVSSLNWTQVLHLISLAEGLYESSDYDGLKCLKKSICEYSQSKKNTSLEKSVLFLFLDSIGTVTLPSIVKKYLKEFREPLDQGRNAEAICADLYSKCSPSFMNFIDEYLKLIRS